MVDLTQMKKKVDELKTQRAIEQNKYNEAMATIKTEFGIADINAAREEYDAITKGIIPKLQLKRDNMLAKAEAILNGIDTQNNGTGGAQPGGNIGRGHTGGAKTGRQIVGLRRDN